MPSLRISALFFVLVAMLLCASGALAQHNESWSHPGEDVPQQDTTVLPLLVPLADDFAPPPAADGEESPEPTPGLGVSANVDYSSYIKSGSLAPSYRFTPALNARLRIPLIFNRTIEFGDGTQSTGGLGDIAIDMEYRRKFGRKGQEIRFTGTLKLPTGDNEKAVDNNHVIPLGTGSLDFLGRVHYTRSTAKTGLLASVLLRMNSAGETVNATTTSTTTISETSGNLFVASVFGRYNVEGPWWLNFGISITKNGDGESDLVYVDSNNSAFNFSSSSTVATKATMIDLYPGVSYNLGLVRPYLGVRLPLATSYDYEDPLFPRLDRDMSVVLQFTYNPKSMTRN